MTTHDKANKAMLSLSNEAHNDSRNLVQRLLEVASLTAP